MNQVIEQTPKYTLHREPKHYPGISLVHFVSMATSLYRNLIMYSSELQNNVRSKSLQNKLAFLPPHTFHITLLDIVLNPEYKLIQDITRQVEREFARVSTNDMSPLRAHVNRQLIITDDTALVLKVTFDSEDSLHQVRGLRKSMLESLHSVSDQFNEYDPIRYFSHISLAYIVQPMSQHEKQELEKIVSSLNTEEVLGELVIDKIELRKFDTMEEWGDKPLALLELTSVS